MRDLDLQNPLLIMFLGISRPIENPSERGLDPCHPLRVEIGPSELLVLNGKVCYAVVEGLIDAIFQVQNLLFILKF